MATNQPENELRKRHNPKMDRKEDAAQHKRKDNMEHFMDEDETKEMDYMRNRSKETPQKQKADPADTDGC